MGVRVALPRRQSALDGPLQPPRLEPPSCRFKSRPHSPLSYGLGARRHQAHTAHSRKRCISRESNTSMATMYSTTRPLMLLPGSLRRTSLETDAHTEAHLPRSSSSAPPQGGDNNNNMRPQHALNCPHRLVVRTSRCGRDNPGSTPGEDKIFPRPLRMGTHDEVRGGVLLGSGRGARGAPTCQRFLAGLYSSVVERQSCKLKVLGSIPSGGFLRACRRTACSSSRLRATQVATGLSATFPIDGHTGD